ESFQNVRAAPDTAVEQHLDTPVDCFDDFLERVERRLHAVELPAAVIRDDDCRGTVLAGELRVLGGEDPLDDDREAVAGEPFEVTPAETGVELPGKDVADDREVLGNLEIDADVALAAAEVRRVDGEHERGEVALHGLCDQL